MSELKIYKQSDILCGHWFTEYCRKDEADKVIAEKDKEIQRLENLCESYRIDCDNLAIREANAYKEVERNNKQLRHQKYKRCLAMARWCLTEKVYFHYRYDDWGDKGYDRHYKWKKVVFWSKWARRWLKLAEQFKEA